MPLINIRTLNGIRTAMTPKGRDVAEALDDIVAAIAKLAGTPTAFPATTPVTQAPTTPVSKTLAVSATTPGTGGSGGGPSPPQPVLQVVEVTGNYTMGSTDYCIEVTSSSNCTIQLLGVQMGTTVTVKNYSSSGVVITIEDSNSGTIDEAASVQMEWQNTSATFIFDGVSNWAVS